MKKSSGLVKQFGPTNWPILHRSPCHSPSGLIPEPLHVEVPGNTQTQACRNINTGIPLSQKAEAILPDLYTPCVWTNGYIGPRDVDILRVIKQKINWKQIKHKRFQSSGSSWCCTWTDGGHEDTAHKQRDTVWCWQRRPRSLTPMQQEKGKVAPLRWMCLSLWSPSLFGQRLVIADYPVSLSAPFKQTKMMKKTKSFSWWTDWNFQSVMNMPDVHALRHALFICVEVSTPTLRMKKNKKVWLKTITNNQK